MKQLLCLLFIFLFLIVGCAPAPFKPFTPPQIKFDKLGPYDVQKILDQIPKPSKLVPIYAKINGDKITELPESKRSEATDILLVPKEYAKVAGLVKLAVTYKSIAIEQGNLINTYIAQINALRELVSIERKKSIMYKELWADSENAYRQEKYAHNRDNLINRTGMYVITMGSIVVIALSL